MTAPTVGPTEQRLTQAEIDAFCYDPHDGGLARINGIGCEWTIHQGTYQGQWLVKEFGYGPWRPDTFRYRCWIFDEPAGHPVDTWAAALRFVCEMSISDLADEITPR